MEQMEEEEKIAVFEMLKTMFRFKPEPQERTTSSQVLRLVWMKEWAMPCHNLERIQANLGKLRGVGNPTTY